MGTPHELYHRAVPGGTRRVPGLISIVTAVLDDRDGLRETLDSVDTQRYRHFEQVVVDGGSTDGTTDLLRERESPHRRWQSERDDGLADAFNRGLSRCRGEWIQFLNAGDRFCDADALGVVAGHLGDTPIVTAFARLGAKTIPARRPTAADPLRRRALISHQASFTHRRVFEEHGGFDPGFRVRMDYEFWLRVLPHYPWTFLERVLVEFRPGGLSHREGATFHREERAANRRHLAHPATANLRAYLRPLWLRLAGR